MPFPLSDDVRRGDATCQRCTGRGQPPRPATAPAGRPTSRGSQLGRPHRCEAARLARPPPLPAPGRRGLRRRANRVCACRKAPPRTRCRGSTPVCCRPPTPPVRARQRTRRGRHGAYVGQAATERRRPRSQHRGGHASGARFALSPRGCARWTSLVGDCPGDVPAQCRRRSSTRVATTATDASSGLTPAAGIATVATAVHTLRP